MAATPVKLRLTVAQRLFASQEKIAALNDGPAVVGQHEAEEAVDIAIFGGAGHLRVDFEDGFFNGGAAGRGESAFLGAGEQGAAEGDAKDESSHGLLLFRTDESYYGADLLRWRRLDTIGKSLVVGLAQLVERQIVVLEVVGSNPTSHPTSSLTCECVILCRNAGS